MSATRLRHIGFANDFAISIVKVLCICCEGFKLTMRLRIRLTAIVALFAGLIIRRWIRTK